MTHFISGGWSSIATLACSMSAMVTSLPAPTSSFLMYFDSFISPIRMFVFLVWFGFECLFIVVVHATGDGDVINVSLVQGGVVRTGVHQQAQFQQVFKQRPAHQEHVFMLCGLIIKARFNHASSGLP